VRKPKLATLRGYVVESAGIAADGYRLTPKKIIRRIVHSPVSKKR
jgi:hypothetical protein